MKTKRELPQSIQQHFDDWDMIGVYHTPPAQDEEGRKYEARGWVDGGDSCHFIGLYYYCLRRAPSVLFYRPGYYGNLPGRLIASEAMLKSRTYWGGYKRHPDTRHWYGGDNRMSRDQWTPMLGSLALWELRPQLRAQLWDYAKRGLIFTTNTRKNGSSANNDGVEYAPGKFRDYSWKVPDLALFDIWALFIRGLNLWYLYPILLIADFQNFINALILLANPQDTDCANFWIKHSLSRSKYTTPFAWLTQKLIYPRLKLWDRIKLRYNRRGEPTFLGHILAYSMHKTQ